MALCLTLSLFPSACQWLSTFFFRIFPICCAGHFRKVNFCVHHFHVVFFFLRVAAFPLIDVCNFTPYEPKPARGQQKGRGKRYAMCKVNPKKAKTIKTVFECSLVYLFLLFHRRLCLDATYGEMVELH